MVWYSEVLNDNLSTIQCYIYVYIYNIKDILFVIFFYFLIFSSKISGV